MENGLERRKNSENGEENGRWDKGLPKTEKNTPTLKHAKNYIL